MIRQRDIFCCGVKAAESGYSSGLVNLTKKMNDLFTKNSNVNKTVVFGGMLGFFFSLCSYVFLSLKIAHLYVCKKRK